MVIEVVAGAVVLVGVVEVVCGVRMCVGVGGVGNKGEGVVSSGGNVSVADGGGARLRDCCRFPNGIFGGLWENLPYCLQFKVLIPMMGCEGVFSLQLR